MKNKMQLNIHHAATINFLQYTQNVRNIKLHKVISSDLELKIRDI